MEEVFSYVFLVLASIVCLNMIYVVFTAWVQAINGDDKNEKNN